MSIQLNKNDNDAMKADNEAMKARMGGMQEKPVRLNQFLKPAEPATFTKDCFNEPDPLSENMESSDSDDGFSSVRSRSSHRRHNYSSRRSGKCPELAAADVDDTIVVFSWVKLVAKWAPGADYDLVEFIRVLNLLLERIASRC